MVSRWLQRQWFEQRRLTPALWLLLPLAGLDGRIYKKLEEMFENIEEWEGDDALLTVQDDVDLKENAREHHIL